MIPKLDSSKDMYVSREKYVAAYKNYNVHYEESKADTIRNVQQSIFETKMQAQAQREENMREQAQMAEANKTAAPDQKLDAIDAPMETCAEQIELSAA